MSVPSYRITPDDLPDADHKTQRAIEPLLDSLNCSLAPAITTLNALSIPLAKSASFTTNEVGAAYLDFGLGAPASEVWVTKLLPRGGTLDSVYSMSWVALSAGARLLFVGLGITQTYDVTVRYFT